MLRVIVTPAVYWSFVRLEPAFRYQHWAGFSGRTKPFDLAATYVLVKQSGLPCHCDQPLARLARLYRRYGANLPNSLAWIFADTPWASHPGAPVSVLGTVARIDPNVLFTGTTDQRKGLRPYSRLHPFLAMPALRGLERLNPQARGLRLPRCVRRWAGIRTVQEY